MSESDQDVEDLDQLVICPYDSSHRVTAARMGHHLIKCRENFPISEKAICPFHGKHKIFAPEMDYHRSVCSYKPGETKKQPKVSDNIDSDGGNPKDKLFGSFSSGTTFNFSSCGANATGCESGLHVVGGIRNFIAEADETGTIPLNAPNGQNQQPQNRLGEHCRDMGKDDSVLTIVELKSPNHNKSIEKQLEQSESDTTSSETNSSIGNEERLCEEERFDYTKYIPSKDLREDFLKLIGHDQPRNGQVYEAKCQPASQPFTMQQWPQDYSVIPAVFQTNNSYQAAGIQPTFVSFSNTFNVIPPVASCPVPYTSSYGFHNPTPGPGFLQTPGQGLGYEYTMYPAARPSNYRSYFRRRNHYNSSRNNNHKSYNSHNHENHAETFLNGLSHSEISLGERSCYLNKLNGTKNHDEMGTSHNLCMKNGCDKEQPLSSPKLRKNCSYFNENNVGDVEEQQQFEGIDGALDKRLIGDSEGEGLVIYNDSQDDITKSEIEKQIRKIKKKLAEINGLEEKYRKGASLDCDQLKKLSRKSEFEDQLQSFHLS